MATVTQDADAAVLARQGCDMGARGAQNVARSAVPYPDPGWPSIESTDVPPCMRSRRPVGSTPPSRGTKCRAAGMGAALCLTCLARITSTSKDLSPRGGAPFHRRLVRRLSTRSPGASAPDGQPATTSEMR